MKSPLRIRVEVCREDLQQAIVTLERAVVREREAQLKFSEALDNLEKGDSKA